MQIFFFVQVVFQTSINIRMQVKQKKLLDLYRILIVILHVDIFLEKLEAFTYDSGKPHISFRRLLERVTLAN